jgi:nucleotide-binding universal stress UspA family protein
MNTFGHILFPVDFSTRSQATLPFVAAWARRFNSRVTLLHTIHIPISAYGGADGYPLMVDVPGIEKTAAKRLDQVEFEGATRVVKMGDPAYEIVQYAQKNDVDLIMMATHGYGPFRTLLLGSVTAKVLHDAHCPVWTSAHSEEPFVHAEVKNILCAIDGPSSPQLIRCASELAKAIGANLGLVHAVAVDETWPEKYLEGDFSAALVEKGREDVAGYQKEAGTSLEAAIEGGAVSRVVREAALAQQADLLMIGSGKVHKPLARLRSNAYAIIRESPCPVISGC